MAERVEDLHAMITELSSRVEALGAAMDESRSEQHSAEHRLTGRLDAVSHELRVLRQGVRGASVARLLTRFGDGATDLTRYELGAFSQNGEDGVLLEILRRLGIRTGRFTEIGAAANEANCVFLCDVLRWAGVFIDAEPAEYARLHRKYRHRADVTVVQASVSPANVHEILTEAGGDQPTVLSIDIDGDDYWVWKALDRVSPEVVVIEHNASIDPGRSFVQPPARGRWDGTDYYGASLEALRRLGARKGYRLVHVELTGNNAFFVREALAESAGLTEESAGRVPNYFLSTSLHPEHRGSGIYIDPEGGTG